MKCKAPLHLLVLSLLALTVAPPARSAPTPAPQPGGTQDAIDARYAESRRRMAAEIDFAHPTKFPAIDTFLGDPRWYMVFGSSQRSHYRFSESVVAVIIDHPEALLRNLIVRFDGADQPTIAKLRDLIVVILSGAPPGETYTDVTGIDSVKTQEFSIRWIQVRALCRGFPAVDSNEAWIKYYQSLDFRFDK